MLGNARIIAERPETKVVCCAPRLLPTSYIGVSELDAVANTDGVVRYASG